MTTLPDVPLGGTLRAIGQATTPAERAKLQAAAMEHVTDDYFERPVPRWIAELPRSGDDAEVQERIAAAVLVAEDPDKAQDEGGTDASKELVNKRLTVWDLRVSKSEKEGGVGAFLILDYTIGDDEVHKVATTGAVQAMARLARAWADDDLPITGSFSAIPGTGAKGSPALTFLAQPDF